MRLAAASLSAPTERAYNEHWAAFSAWCEQGKVRHLPADPAVVATYLAERSQTVGKSALRVTLAAMAHVHRRSGYAWSSGHPIIASVLKGILREQKRPVKPSAALTSTEVRAMLAEMGDNLAGHRDRALLLIGLAGGLRRSELVALDVEDFQWVKDGLVLRIRSSKTDQEGQGANLGIARGSRPETCPVEAVKNWLRKARIEYGPVFRSVHGSGRVGDRLTTDGFRHILLTRAKAAGVEAPEGERLSPHGLRAGLITEAYLNGALDEVVARHARHKSIHTTRAYRVRAKVIMESPSKLLDL
ncbi:tyrosine-type recombinase/integrase [Acidisoma cellulosilytica]|uniref:Tyrosine-type recombinase/integrase n=1 Tax=Acidisoma cellulosilyticum TaxID=2802395 RepID=A0A964E6U5_9PROT|nr:tyrosine-type recombinase/integrase [Acidisoma cellulosilyticum]MCB8883949.1 tyrosine-type recombinase/integrase [Acidisoma cellulosilyticum]